MLIAIDIRTIVIFSGLLSLMILFIMIYVPKIVKTYSGFMNWTYASLLFFLGSFLFALRDIVPDIISIVAANILIIVATLLLARGLATFLGARQTNHLDIFFMAAGIFTVTYFTYQLPDASIRIASLSFLYFLITLRCVYLVYRYSPNMLSRRNWMLTSLFLLLAFFHVTRTISLIFFRRTNNNFMESGPLGGFLFIALVVVYLALCIGFIIFNSQRLEADLRNALVEVQTLEGLIPICSSCKNIRDDKGYWNQIDVYIAEHTKTKFSHGICPPCMEKLYPEEFEELNAKKA